MVKGKIVAVCISEEKGTRKANVGAAYARENWGLDGDAHAGRWHRQISLLGIESIQSARDRGLDVGPGDFAENITTEGLALVDLPIGTRLKLGEALVQVTQIGKDPHEYSAIHDLIGDSLIPGEGIFARVIRGGGIQVGDGIEVVA
jgi:MOSC domain-containing protein YiiM